MTECNRFQSGSTHSYGTAYTSGVSCGVSVPGGASNREAGLNGRARAAAIVQAITQMLEDLAADVPTRDFVWARLAIDSCIDRILFGHQMD
jgi:hypothetical protein